MTVLGLHIGTDFTPLEEGFVMEKERQTILQIDFFGVNIVNTRMCK